MNSPPFSIGLPVRLEALGRLLDERVVACAQDRGSAGTLRIRSAEATTR